MVKRGLLRGMKGIHLPEEHWLGLVVLTVGFALGLVLGCLFVGQVEGTAGESLQQYLHSYLDSLQASATTPQLFLVLWSTLRWPLLALLMGFAGLGMVGLPLLFLMRGFLLSFSTAAFILLFGEAGCILAFILFGVTSIFALPALFVLGVQSFGTARTLAGRLLGEGRGSLPFGRHYWRRCSYCGCSLAVSMLLEYTLVPRLLSGLTGLF